LYEFGKKIRTSAFLFRKALAYGRKKCYNKLGRKISSQRTKINEQKRGYIYENNVDGCSGLDA
jgi:hypothetical protein